MAPFTTRFMAEFPDQDAYLRNHVLDFEEMNAWFESPLLYPTVYSHSPSIPFSLSLTLFFVGGVINRSTR